jgi:hypothetical protein
MLNDDQLRSITLLTSAIAAGVTFREYLGEEGKKRIAVYSSGPIGRMLYYWAYYTNTWIDVFAPPEQARLWNDYIIGTFAIISSEMLSKYQHDVILVDNNDWKDVARIKELQKDASILNIDGLLVRHFNNKVYRDPILDFAKQRSAEKILVCKEVSLADLDDGRSDALSSHERNVANFQSEWNLHRKEPGFFDPIWQPHDLSDDYVAECTHFASVEKQSDGTQALVDRKGNYVNVVNGFRVTTDSPSEYKGSVWVFGSSRVFGSGADDAHTTPSYLQRLINERGYAFHVVNCSNYAGGQDAQQVRLLKKLPIEKNDIVIFMLSRYDRFHSFEGLLPTLDLTNVLRRPHDLGEVFWDTSHYNFIGYHALAEAVFEALEANCAFCVDEKRGGGGGQKVPFSHHRSRQYY